MVEGTVSMVMKVEGVEDKTKAVVEAGAGEGAVGLAWSPYRTAMRVRLVEFRLSMGR